ncbi:MAG: hypothetical protein Q4A70_00750 [Candidatus Saccharibacteria bacterium]|nr:hypothetical protein [Candidatus Saccharibacteria bacterium]
MGKQDIDIKISLSLVGLVLIAASFLLNAHAFADDVVDQINITVPESCTVEGIIATGGEHTKTVQNNQYYSEIGTTTFKTYCNDNNGYAIYAVGYSNDEIGNTLMKHNVSSAYDFDTGVANSGNTSNWAMKLAPISGTYAPTIHSDTNGAFSSYHVVPSEYTKVVSFASNTDLPATGVNAVGSGFTSTYASWISATQVAGTYTGKVRYTLVHPMTEVPLQPQTTEAGKICYYPNDSNVEGTMGCQTIPASGTTDGVSPTSATLLASNFSRAGYGFAGWSTTYDYSDDTGFLGPQEDITFTAGQYTGSNNGLSLYARWIKSTGNLQGWTGCPSLSSGAVIALTDQRDNETYAVAKLADGKCWMIENLRLKAGDSDDETLAQGFGKSTIYGNFVGLADAENTGFTSTYSANSLYSNDGSNDTINIGTGGSPAYRMPRYNSYNTPTSTTDRPQNPTSNSETNSTTGAGMYSYGNYYTWSAAMASTIYYDSPTATDADGKTSETVGTSLCPAGWRLPRGGNKSREATNDLWALIVTGINNGTNPANYDSATQPYYTGTAEAGPVTNALRAYPNNFLYSGYFNTASARNRGSSGYYWSSTAYYYDYSYSLGLYSSNVYPGTSGISKYYGQSIRCTVGS